VLKPIFFESAVDAEAYAKEKDLNATVMEYDMIPMVFHQEARPFIEFPADGTTEGWIKVAEQLEQMITYLIEMKVQKITVKFVDKREDDTAEPLKNYGLNVALQRGKMPYSEFRKLLKQGPRPKPSNNEDPP